MYFLLKDEYREKFVKLANDKGCTLIKMLETLIDSYKLEDK